QACGIPYLLAQRFTDARICQLDDCVIGKFERVHVQRIRVAMFAHPSTSDAIKSAATKRSERFDPAQRRNELRDCRGHVVSYPLRDGFRHRAAKSCRWREHDSLTVEQVDCVERYYTSCPTFAGTGNGLRRFEFREFGQSQLTGWGFGVG